MRLFIAADINMRAKNLIAKKQEILKRELKEDLNWVKKENWHLTIKFLGDSTESEKEKLITALKEIDYNLTANYIQFDHLDAFPNQSHPKVLYLAVNKGKNILTDIYNKTENKLLNYGFEADERDFIPHLTIARSKSEYPNLNAKLLDKNFLNIYANIEQITLYESRLKNDGPEYIELFSIK